MDNISRRTFLKSSLVAGAGLAAAPAFASPLFVPSKTLKGENAPSNRINIGVIGTGRIGITHDMPGVMKFEFAHIIAVCDLDAKRAENAKQFVVDYRKEKFGKTDEVKVYENYEELLANPEIDAVIICTPDHWHAKIAIEAVRAGKDVYCEKPTSLTIAEGRLMSNAVNSTGRIFQLGTQQRSSEQFRIACELVRNGRLGTLKEVEVRLPGDPAGGDPTPMPVPDGFNYEKWLGSTPYVPYTVDRVHPTNSVYDRPGWLRCEQFGAGMITGWGNHHFDIAQWAMGTEYTGPVEISGTADFPTEGLWDVHGDYHTEMLYANGVKVYGITESQKKPNGILFTGTEGWLFVCRGDYKVTASDPGNSGNSPLVVSDAKIIRNLSDSDIHLTVSDDHHLNWLNAIRTRQQPISPAEVGHRSCSVCLLQHIAMKLGRKLYWDPVLERFKNDDEANAMLSRPERYPYQIVRGL